MSTNPNDTADAADAVIMRALVTWSPRDKRILAALIELGPPSQLHAGFPDVPTESCAGPGGVTEVWRAGGQPERARSDALHAYRTIAQPLGLLPPPGQVKP